MWKKRSASQNQLLQNQNKNLQEKKRLKKRWVKTTVVC